MKRFVWLTIGWFVLAATDMQAQYYPPRSLVGPGYGVEFRYHSGRLSINGFLRHGYPRGYYFNPYYGPPVNVIERRVVREVYAPPRVVLPPLEHEYDVTGVDLDLVNPPTKIETDKKEPEPPLPGKNVSVPKKVIRPGGPQPKPKKPLPPMKPGTLPQPPGPLPNPEKEADRQITAGVIAFQNKDFGLAAQRFQRAIDTDPKNALGWFLRAQAEFALGFYEDATRSIEQGMQRRLDWPLSKFAPRVMLYKGNEPLFEQHVKRLDTVTGQNPKRADFLFLAAHQRWFDGRRVEAIALFRKARALSKNVMFIDRFLNAGAAKVVRGA